MGDQNGFEDGVYSLIFSRTEISLSDYENDLPSLPVPPLKQTLQKYLQSVKPFLSEKELSSTESIVKDFESGVGQKLQAILEERGKQKKNWMEEWWTDYAYLCTRTPLIPTSNMAGNHPLNLDSWPPIDANALKYGAISIWIIMEFYKNIRRGLLKPHSSFSGEKLSMSQFHDYFNMCRIPNTNFDELRSWFQLEKDGTSPTHVIVFCNGHIWKLDPWDEKDQQLQVNELEKLLGHIRTESYSMPPGPQISALTLSDRDVWLENRKYIQSLSAKNVDNLTLIESAVFHMVLEDSRPNNVSEAYSHGLCGYSGNRWADKGYTIIIYANGYVASNSEHSPADAMVSVLIGIYAVEHVHNEIDGIWREEPTSLRSLSYPKRVLFDLDDRVTKVIPSILDHNYKLQDQIDARYHMFTTFGKDWIKSQKIHVDTFIQCAIQLAYYRMHKKLAPTYETATTRKFYHGRTETLRSCTVEMADWLKSMTSSKAKVAEKRSKLRIAMALHLQNMRLCQNGQGIDRHLLGLYIASREAGMELPHLFVDPAFSKSGGGGNFTLSTSTVGTGHAVGGVVPMVKDGYAVMYCFLPERINLTLTTYRQSGTCSQGFITALESSLVQLRDLVREPTSHL